MSRMSTQCTLKTASGFSPGRTSIAQLSLRIAATSRSWSHSQQSCPMPGSPAMNSVGDWWVEELPSPPGPEQQDVAASDIDVALSGDRGIEVVGGDDVSEVEPLDALEPGDVEQHPSAGDPLALLVDAVARRTDDGHLRRREAVVHLVVVEDVGERVPLRRALQRHEDVVVGVLEAAGEQLRVAGLAHEVHGVDAPATGLRARRRRTGCRGRTPCPTGSSCPRGTSLSGVMKFTVPRSSSAPQRPQFESRLPRLRKSSISLSPSSSIRLGPTQYAPWRSKTFLGLSTIICLMCSSVTPRSFSAGITSCVMWR